MSRREIDMEEAERIERSFTGLGDPPTTRNISVGAGFTRLFMDALTDKSLLWFAVTSSVGLWTYAAIAPDPLRLGAAGGVTLLVYIPMLWKKR
jgi:hypothetical protein